MKPLVPERPLVPDRPLVADRPFVPMRPLVPDRPLAEVIANSCDPCTSSACSLQPTMPTTAPSEKPTVMPKRMVRCPKLFMFGIAFGEGRYAATQSSNRANVFNDAKA